jgi:PAS domain S-box-containing protein
LNESVGRIAWRYAIAVLATAAGILLTAWLQELLAPMRLFFLWVAVLVTALTAGIGPALVAIALSLAAATWVLRVPSDPYAIVRLSMFAAFATAICLAVGMRRRAEQRASRASSEAQRNETRYRTLAEHSGLNQAVWTASPDGKINWSEQWSKITGQSREELEQAGIRIAHPEDGARVSGKWKRALATGSIFEDEVRVRMPDGHYRWFGIRGVPVRGQNGNVLEWIGIIADIDGRRRLEEHSAFINKASDVLTSSLQHEETLRNLARLCVPMIADWCAIHLARGDGGYNRFVVEASNPEQLSLIPDAETRPPRDRDVIAQVIASGKAHHIEYLTDDTLQKMMATADETSLIRRLGFRSWIAAPMTTRGRTIGVLTVVYGESGRLYAREDVPLIEDLAARAATAVDNAMLFEAAETANRAKDEFLATLSHELRTPLTAISGWAHMMQLGMIDADTSKLAVDTILRSARQQGELIDDLLDLSRVVAGTLHLNVTTVNLAAIIDDVLNAAKPAADARGLNLSVKRDQPEPLVRGDERRLRQIVWNLVTNAVKFTDEGGSVHVELSRRDQNACVAVTDTGRGIDPSFLPYVWDRFRQADSSTSRQHGGLGLGLSVVRHLVELHGGTVRASSAGLGQGATFSFEIPLARSGEQRAPLAAEAEQRQVLRGCKLLLVDDDVDARIVIAAMLRQAGSEVTAVDSVDAAIEKLRERTFDVIITDIAMPGEDGYALLRRARELTDAPVVAVSAIGSAVTVDGAIGSGFAGFVRKPVDPEQLAQAVASAAKSRS